jgi:hypothetical protein
VRRALISDINGNLKTLEVVLGDINALGIPEIFCLGDITGDGLRVRPKTVFFSPSPSGSK